MEETNRRRPNRSAQQNSPVKERTTLRTAYRSARAVLAVLERWLKRKESECFSAKERELRSSAATEKKLVASPHFSRDMYAIASVARFLTGYRRVQPQHTL